MKNINIKVILNSLVIIFAFCIIVIFLSSCGGESDTADSPSSNTGSIVFSLEFLTDEKTSSELQIARVERFCVENNNPTIKAQIFDENNEPLVESEPWPCLAGEGTVTGVEAGENRTVVVLAIDESEVTIFRGESLSPITVEPGEVTDAGTIVATPFVPTLSAPEDGSTVTLNEFSLTWEIVENAYAYNILVSEDSNFGTPIIDDTTTNTSYTPSGLSASTTYYWKVCARDIHTNQSAYSEPPWSFTTAIDTWTVTFVPGANGSITGDLTQVVAHGGNCTEVTAVPDTGYAFVNWTGDYTGTDNPLTVTNVTSDMTITANFAPIDYTVTFVPGANGSITGDLTQDVAHGGDCTAVTAVPDANYHFVNWTGDYTGTDNPLTVTNVTSDMTITANFAINTYTVTFVPGANGSITGDLTQVVAHGGNCTEVTAVPDTGYAFVNWTGDYTGTENPLTVTNVTSDMTITANFAINECPVADAGPDQMVFVGDTVTLDGSGSYDEDQDPITYAWSLNVPEGSQATLSDPTAVNPTFDVDVSGTYVAQLIVNDGTCDSNPDEVIIEGYAEWVRLLGTPADDYSYGIDLDSNGNCYVAGWTEGNLDGNTNEGDKDIFISKFDADGNKQWTILLGTTVHDSAWGGIAVDVNGNLYITGETLGDLDGQTNSGDQDAFIAKYDANGNKQWVRLFGTAAMDSGYSISVDLDGNPYVSGGTQGDLDGETNVGGLDVFITKYDADGNRQWTRLLGSTEDEWGRGIAVDSNGNSYISGGTYGDLDGNTNSGSLDIFISKYDTNGNRQWTRLSGTAESDSAFDGIAVDSAGNCYIAGSTRGDLGGNTNAGESDIFVAKFDTDGNELWTKLLGTANDENNLGLALNSDGNCYITGVTLGDLDGNTNAGAEDIFVTKYDTDGNRQWTQLLGTPFDDTGRDIAVDLNGNTSYVTGYTAGDLGDNINSGSYDIFIWRLQVYDDIYEENDTMETAYDITNDESNLLYAIQYDSDWYEFYTEPYDYAIIVDLAFIHNDGDLNLELYNSAGDLLYSSTSNTDNEVIGFYNSGVGGTYYIRVYGYPTNDTGNNYALMWLYEPN